MKERLTDALVATVMLMFALLGAITLFELGAWVILEVMF